MLSKVLDTIEELKLQVDSLRPIPAETMAKIMQKFRFDWNYHSNAIEGNSLTYGETKTFLLHGNTASGKPLKDHLEIKGHNEAIIELEEIVKGKVELSEHMIRGFHQLILGEPYSAKAITIDGAETTKQIIPGKYKSQPNHVRTATGEIFYFTEPHLVQAEMELLLTTFRENQNKKEIHSLLLAATFHYNFIRIHPFDDGNGRIARILMNLILMMNGYPPVIIKTEDKENYFRALRQADGGELEPFTEYIGNLLVHSLELMLKGANGESIEDEDDLDKRLKLLLAQIDENHKNSIQVKRNSSHVFESVVQSIIPLIEEVGSILPKMKDFFLDVAYEISTPLAPSGETKYQNTKQLKESYRTYARNVDESFPENITVNITLAGYKHGTLNLDVNLNGYLYIFFYDYKFTIHTSFPGKMDLVSPYNKAISREQIKDFANNLLAHWITKLEALPKE